MSPRTELAAALDARLFGREAKGPRELASRARFFAQHIDRTVEIARDILAGKRRLLPRHLRAIEPLIGQPEARAIGARETERREERRGRPLSDRGLETAFRRVEAAARRAEDVGLAERVRALREKLLPTPPDPRQITWIQA